MVAWFEPSSIQDDLVQIIHAVIRRNTARLIV